MTSLKNQPETQAAFFALSVSDVALLAAWYSEYLGFHIDIEGEVANGGPKFAMLSRDGALLELLQFPTAKSREASGLTEETHQVHGFLKIGFVVADLEALFSTAESRGLNIFFPIVQPPNVPWRTFGVKDPDHNIVQFFQFFGK